MQNRLAPEEDGVRSVRRSRSLAIRHRLTTHWKEHTIDTYIQVSGMRRNKRE